MLHKKITRFGLRASTLFALLWTKTSYAASLTEKLNDVARGIWTTVDPGSGVTGQQQIASIVGLVIGVLLSFLGVLFIILIIYAGFLWMTAHGNEDQVTKAKGILRSSLTGLFIILVAYAITQTISYLITTSGVLRG